MTGFVYAALSSVPVADFTAGFAAIGLSAVLVIGAGWALRIHKRREAEGEDARAAMIVAMALLFLSMVLAAYAATTATV